MRITVPARFWDDHADRCPCDNPETDMCDEVERKGNRVTIECNDKQLSVLRSDAEYYCDRWGPDEAPRSIKQSAVATLAAIAKQVAA